MNAKYPVLMALYFGVAIGLVLISCMLFLISVQFGIQHGEARVGDASSAGLKFDRAGNIAFGLFLATAIGAAGSLLPIALTLLPKINWGICLLVAVLLTTLSAYLGVLVLIAMTGVPDVAVPLQQLIARSILRVS